MLLPEVLRSHSSREVRGASVKVSSYSAGALWNRQIQDDMGAAFLPTTKSPNREI